MEEALVQLQAKDTKERMAGVERLQTLLEQCRKSLTAAEVSSLVDASIALLKDNNFKVAQGALQALASAAALAGEHLKLHFNALLPATVERLGDSKQPVRDAGRRFLLALMEISSPTTIVERAGAYAWSHKNWRVREEFARTAASALNLFNAAELPFQRLILPSVLHLLEDSNSSVREAAMLCLEEMYQQGGQQFGDELQRHQLRASQFKEIHARFEKIEPARNLFDKQRSSSAQCVTPPNRFSAPANHSKPVAHHAATNQHWPVSDLKVTVSGGSTRGNSPRSKLASDGDSAMVEKPADPIRVFSEKDLAKEFEKAASMLAPAQDWSIRMSALQRIEGIIAGGATKYSGFLHLLKQLLNPLCDQLADRRSSIVKQACQLLKVLTKELKQDFEPFAESFLPMLFKLVVITVLVIAESADACIKSMLQHCKVARVLPKMVELAKHDRNAVLRARCCEYLLLVLEHWFDSPEMQRAAELYEDLIKCCCGDAMSEVRSVARQCYRVFARCWPDRARRLYQAFDPVTQRVINDEDGGILKKYGHSTVHDTHQFRNSTGIPTLATALSAPSSALNSSNGLQSATWNGYNTNPVSRPSSSVFQRKSSEGAAERNLQSVLQASQQQVNAIESMLKGVSVDDQGSYFSTPQATVENSYSKIHSAGGNWPLRAGVDPPSSRDPPHQASGTAPFHQPNLSAFRPGIAGRTLSGPSAFGDMDAGRFAEFTGMSRESEFVGDKNQDFARSLGKTQSAKRIPMSVQKYSTRSSNGDYDEPKQAKRIPKLEGHIDRTVADGNSHAVPAYQRPLLRQTVSGRSAGNRSSLEDSLPTVVMNSSGEVFTYMDGLMSLNDALTEGLTPGSDWSARVAAFTFLKRLLQQGSKGLQEVGQSFERVMRLFSEHLDDPHHKVAQAALSTLVELVPACRKYFETYLERILPHVFARLVDAKEVIRQLSTSALETVGNTYSIDALLPALLRSLDEQRSPKAKMAVIEFAIAAFAKLALNGEASGGSGLLKLWLAKLAPLVHDKNAKLKETAVTGLISVYSHFDSTIVLNFILGLSIEEQSTLRRALKHYTPRIEVDLMIHMQNRSQRKQSKSGHERPSTSSTMEEKDEDYTEQVSPTGERNQMVAGYSAVALSNMGRKWAPPAQPDAMNMTNQEGAMSSMTDQSRHSYPPFPYVGDSSTSHSLAKDSSNNVSSSAEITTSWFNQTQDQQSLGLTNRHNVLPLVNSEGVNNLDSGLGMVANSDNLHYTGLPANTHNKDETDFYHQKMNSKSLSPVSSDSSSGVLQMSSWDGGKAMAVKENALQQLMELSHRNDSATWSKVGHVAISLLLMLSSIGSHSDLQFLIFRRKAGQFVLVVLSKNQYYNQIITLVLEALDDPEATIRELAASVMLELLKNQKERLDKDTEVLLEKLLLSARDTDSKVSAAADLCLNSVLTELDTYRCLSVVVPLLVSENEKTLVTCISCLTKLVSRLPPEELTSKLNSFLPMLFDAFGNQDADVRKTVVFCLVEIYIVLGKSFVPYLGSLSSTQLRLVTIYANRISQARMGSASPPTQPL